MMTLTRGGSSERMDSSRKKRRGSGGPDPGYNPSRPATAFAAEINTGSKGHSDATGLSQEVRAGSTAVRHRRHRIRQLTYALPRRASLMVRFRQSRWVCALAALLFVFGLAGAAFAQTDVTTSRISGTVEDSSKAPL